MEDQKLSRREQRKLRRRQEMLATAYEMFSQKGYHNVSMHQIAAQAEFAVGTLYRFFRNKEDLYKTIVLEWCDDFEDAFRRALEQSDDEVERLRHYVRLRREGFRHNIPFVRLFLVEVGATSCGLEAGVDDEVSKRYHDILKRLASIFECGMKNKRFRKIADPFFLAVAFDSVIDTSLAFWLYALELRYPSPLDQNALVDIFLRGLTEP
jgi:AcrR family transcriptional regulator